MKKERSFENWEREKREKRQPKAAFPKKL